MNGFKLFAGAILCALLFAGCQSCHQSSCGNECGGCGQQVGDCQQPFQGNQGGTGGPTDDGTGAPPAPPAPKTKDTKVESTGETYSALFHSDSSLIP